MVSINLAPFQAIQKIDLANVNTFHLDYVQRNHSNLPLTRAIFANQLNAARYALSLAHPQQKTDEEIKSFIQSISNQEITEVDVIRFKEAQKLNITSGNTFVMGGLEDGGAGSSLACLGHWMRRDNNKTPIYSNIQPW